MAVRARPRGTTMRRARDRTRLRRHVLPLVARCRSRRASACNRRQTSRSFGQWSPFSLVRRAFAIGSQRVTLLMDSDSHSETTRQRIAALLDGRAVDFLFIHGDHSYKGVWQDFEMYSPFVAPGGLVAFHDISQNPAQRTKGVAQFWREFTVEHETEQRVVNDEPGFGSAFTACPDDLTWLIKSLRLPPHEDMKSESKESLASDYPIWVA